MDITSRSPLSKDYPCLTNPRLARTTSSYVSLRNKSIQGYLARVKGLGRVNVQQELRKREQDRNAKWVSPVFAYDTGEEETPESKEKPRRKLLNRRRRLRYFEPRKNYKRSADDTHHLLDSPTGKIIIPLDHYHQTLNSHKGHKVLITQLNLQETEEMKRHFQRIAERLSPSVQRRLVIRAGTPLGNQKSWNSPSLTPKGSDLEQVKGILDRDSPIGYTRRAFTSRKMLRSATPQLSAKGLF